MDSWLGSGTTLERRKCFTTSTERLTPWGAPRGTQDDVQWVLNTAHGCGFRGSIGHRLGLHGCNKNLRRGPKADMEVHTEFGSIANNISCRGIPGYLGSSDTQQLGTLGRKTGDGAAQLGIDARYKCEAVSHLEAC